MGEVAEGGGKDQVAAGQAGQDAAHVDGDVGRSPERIAPDGAVPGDVPLAADHGGGNAEDGTPDVPGYSLNGFGGDGNGRRNCSGDSCHAVPLYVYDYIFFRAVRSVSAGDGRGQLGLGFGPGCVSGAACRGFFHSGWAIFRHRAGRGWELRRRVLRVPRNPRILLDLCVGCLLFGVRLNKIFFT